MTSIFYDKIVDFLKETYEVSPCLSVPAHPMGRWGLDVTIRGNFVDMVWDKKRGYGLAINDGGVYGEDYPEWYKTQQEVIDKICRTLPKVN
jgi:hypothetical protein